MKAVGLNLLIYIFLILGAKMLSKAGGGAHCFEDKAERIFILQMSVWLSSMTRVMIAISLPEEIGLFFMFT